MSKDLRKGDRHRKDGPPQRSVRGISDELWQAAKEKAAREGADSVSDAIRKLVEKWVQES